MTAEPKNKPQRAFTLPKDDRRIKTGKLNSSVHFNSFTVGRGAKLINQQRTSDTGSTLTKSRKSNISQLKRVLSLISFHLWAFERLWFEMQPYCRFYQTYSKNKFNISRSHDLISSRHFLTIAEGEVKVLRNDYHVADSLKR